MARTFDKEESLPEIRTPSAQTVNVWLERRLVKRMDEALGEALTIRSRSQFIALAIYALLEEAAKGLDTIGLSCHSRSREGGPE